jgi:hypothetical protein
VAPAINVLTAAPQRVAAKEIKMTLNALVFASNYEGTENQLNGCLNDAQYWADVHNSDVVNADSCTELLAGDMTKANMVEAIEEGLDAAVDNSVFDLTYSGHGTIAPPGLQSWVPNDFDWDDKDTWLTYDELDHIFMQHEKRGVLVVVISDSCHSKADPRLHFRDLSNPKKTKNRFLEPPAHIQKRIVASPFHRNVLTVNQDDLLLSGCKRNQTSADAYIGDSYHGAFTYSLSQSIDPFLKGLTTAPSYTGSILKGRAWLATHSYDQVPSVDGDPKIAAMPYFQPLIAEKTVKRRTVKRKK